MLLYNKNLKRHSRELRKNMTDAERKLWSNIRMKRLNGYQFYRQKVIGNYIVDFYCPGAKLVIEVDGGQHSSDQMVKADIRRDRFLRDCGLKVLRFNDTEVSKNIEGVFEVILENVTSRK